MTKKINSSVNFPYLNKLELELLTPEQAKIMNNFTRQQWRRDKVYEGHTVPVPRTLLEDRTPNGSMDRYGRLKIGCKSLDLKGIDAQIATALAHGHTQADTAKLLGLTIRQVEYRVQKMRACPWYSKTRSYKTGLGREQNSQLVADRCTDEQVDDGARTVSYTHLTLPTTPYV